MNILYPILLILFSISIKDFAAQTSESKFAQFMMTNVDSREKVLEIDQFMRNQQGVEEFGGQKLLLFRTQCQIFLA